MGIRKQVNKLDKLDKKAADGKISYNKLVKDGGKIVAKIEKMCPHKDKTSETVNGVAVTYCNDCGGEV